MDVMIPIGISIGLINVRLTKSAKQINNAPAKAESGIKARWFGPMINRKMCGITNPTNPMIPEKATVAPTIAVEQSKTTNFTFLVSTPIK